MNDVLKQYGLLIQMGSGPEQLEEMLSSGDGWLLLSQRSLLSEMDLSDKEKISLEKLDKELSDHFTKELLNEYARWLENYPVKKWWG